METMNTTTTNNKREGGEKDEDEEDKKRAKKEELEEDELETQETHNTWSANEEILEEEVYVQDLGKVSDDVKVVEAEKKSWNRKPLARPIDGQTDSIRTFWNNLLCSLFLARSYSFSLSSSLCALGDFQTS